MSLAFAGYFGVYLLVNPDRLFDAPSTLPFAVTMTGAGVLSAVFLAVGLGSVWTDSPRGILAVRLQFVVGLRWPSRSGV